MEVLTLVLETCNTSVAHLHTVFQNLTNSNNTAALKGGKPHPGPGNSQVDFILSLVFKLKTGIGKEFRPTSGLGGHS